MPNVHTPERIAGETRQQYRDRRAQSKARVREMTRGPSQPPAVNKLDVSRFWLGQHTNPLRRDRRRAVRELGIRQFKRQQRREHDTLRNITEAL